MNFLLFVPDNQAYLINIVVGIVLSLAIATLLESQILYRLGWADKGRCYGFAAASNMITPVLAFIYLVVVIIVLSFYGFNNLLSIEQNGTIIFSTALIFGLGIFLLRHQVLVLLKIRSDIWSWVYAFISMKVTFWLVGILVYLFFQILYT